MSLKVGLFAPAGKVKQEEVHKCIEFLESKGIAVTWNPRIFTEKLWFAGGHKERADAFLEILNEKIDCLLAVRGGSGSIHLLPYLKNIDFAAYPHLIVAGFSDITTLLNYFLAKTQWTIYHAPVACSLCKHTKETQENFISHLQGNWHNELAGKHTKNLIIHQHGKASGKIIGGNLATINSLSGTAWEISFHNKIVFLEDVNEAPYKIERMVSQLYYQGKFKNIARLVLGSFLYNGEEITKETFSQIFLPFLPKNVPFISNFPAGHGKDNYCLPLGKQALLSTIPLSFTCIAHNSISL